MGKKISWGWKEDVEAEDVWRKAVGEIQELQCCIGRRWKIYWRMKEDRKEEDRQE